VLRPGEYVLPARSSINDALSVAGGLTPGAYVYGTEFSRESVRVTQQDNYERAFARPRNRVCQGIDHTAQQHRR